ncbi:MAG: helix-turn-helix transcriptional regulator [Alphaproteobacteria bacterium]
MIEPADLLCIQDRLFAAACAEATFPAVIGEAATAFGAEGSLLFEVDNRDGRVVSMIAAGLDPPPAAERERLHQINPRMRYAQRHAAGLVVCDHQFIDDRGMDRSEFYDAIGRHSGLRCFIGSRLFDDGDISLYHTLEFATRHGRPDRAQIEAFRRLAPNVGRAWRLARQSGGGHTADAWVPDHVPWAVFALDHAGKVLRMNRLAEAIVRDGGGLRVDRGALAARARQADALLRGAIGSALRGEDAVMLVPRAGAAPLALRLIPLPATSRVDPRHPAVVAHVHDPQQPGPGRMALMRRLYGLSAAEERVVALLAEGKDLEESAAVLGISRNTARNHLQSVFAKTGTRRQSELMVRILGLPPG